MKYSSWRGAAVAFFAVLLLVGSSQHSEAAEPVTIIPFRFEGKLMIVDVSINGSAPTPFVVDTGAPHSVLDPRFANALGLTSKEVTPIKGAGAGTVKTSQAPPLQLSLGDFHLEVAEPWVIDLSRVPIPETVRGLVGAEIFASHVVRIDPTTRTMNLFDPAAFQANAQTASIPLLVERDRLFLEAILAVNGKRETHELRIDTGSESSMNDDLVRESSESQPITGGNGLGEPFASRAGYFDSVQIGPFIFEHIWASGDPGPAIGMELLARFVLTFDALHGRLYLEPVATR